MSIHRVEIRTIINSLLFLRIRDWWYLPGIYFLGVVSGGNHPASLAAIAAGYISSMLYLAHGYLVNEYFDEIKYVKSPRVTFQGIYPSVLISLIFLSFIANLIVAYCMLPKIVLIFVLMGALCSWSYSSYPLRLKRFPLWSLFLNAMGFSMLFLIGLGVRSSFHTKGIVLFLYVFCLFIPIELMHTLNDMQEDAKEGINSFILHFGIKKTLWATIVCLALLDGITAIGSLRGTLSAWLFILSLLLSAGWIVLIAVYYIRYGASVTAYTNIKKTLRFLLMAFGVAWLLLSL